MLRYLAHPLLGKVMRNPLFYRACPRRVGGTALIVLKRVPDLRLRRRKARSEACRRGTAGFSRGTAATADVERATAIFGLGGARVRACPDDYFGMIPKPIAQRSIDPAAKTGKKRQNNAGMCAKRPPKRAERCIDGESGVVAPPSQGSQEAVIWL
ncbi:hypothetical protein [Paraburkholderia sp. DHOC27]|uniref:hypothetical protein n=1 Tax=Paraburkholderia sp. DHOC27 TaxID=2303330 RepID=UPI000E3DF597|nr:hypothetical protein [Paraburkholderia sp. DHOC27]RFU47253.1 hypothetical protein D0B32_14010 [Paraburkholderia sp. DHOC27]